MTGKAILKIILLLLLTTSLSHAATKEQRFTKLDANGNILPDDAATWAMVKDSTTQLVWEVKTDDGSIHYKNNLYSYNEAEEILIAELNRIKFGGFSDWRMPANEELYSIRVKGAEPYINSKYFPNTLPTEYHSWRLCGSGEIFNEKVKFGKTRSRGSIRPARAVHGENK